MNTETAVARVPMPISVQGVSEALYARMEKFREDLEFNLPAIMAVLPAGVSAAGLATTALTATLDNPKLLDCTSLSLFRAVYKAAALNLRIGETVDIVPIKGKAECWTRVKGVVELAQRSRAIQWARVGAVCTGEVFEYEERDTGTHFRHVPSATPKADASNVTHVYAIIVLPSKERVYEVWTIEKALEHKRRFAKDTKPDSAWAQHPLAMMTKSVVKAALRFAPLSPEVQRAIGAGDGEDSAVPMVDNPTKALELAAGALDAIDQMDDADVVEEEKMTLADAEAMLLPGAPNNPKVWGGKGGKPLGTIKSALLERIVAWVAADDTRAEKFEALAVACDVILQARFVPDGDGAVADEPSEDLAA